MGMLFTLVILLSAQGVAGQPEGWQIHLELRSLAAPVSRKLVIGQAVGAGEGVDGRYDVPALGGGELEAYFLIDGKPFWKDVRAFCEAACETHWQLVVARAAPGDDLEVVWPTALPDGWNYELHDPVLGAVVEMKNDSTYVFRYAARRILKIIVRAP